MEGEGQGYVRGGRERGEEVYEKGKGRRVGEGKGEGGEEGYGKEKGEGGGRKRVWVEGEVVIQAGMQALSMR